MRIKTFTEYLYEQQVIAGGKTLGHYLGKDSHNKQAELLSLHELSQNAIRTLTQNGYIKTDKPQYINASEIVNFNKDSNLYQLKSSETSKNFTKFSFFVDPFSKENKSTYTVAYPNGQIFSDLYVNSRLKEIEKELIDSTAGKGKEEGKPLPSELIKKYNLKPNESCGCHVHVDAFVPIYNKPVVININGRDIAFYSSKEETDIRKILRPYGLNDDKYSINHSTTFDSKFKGWQDNQLIAKDGKVLFSYNK